MEKQAAATENQAATKPSFFQRLSNTPFIAACRRHKFISIPIAVMILLLPLLGLLALRNNSGAHAQWTSPVVYPSPQGYGAGNWSSAYTSARALTSQMTLAELANITLGVSHPDNGCVGVSGSVPRLDFPGLCLHDEGNGVRLTDGVNAYASGISAGASWNASLALQRAQFMGREFKRKGVNVALGPVTGPIGRVAVGGRNWEGFAADAYLDGVLGARTVEGLQESVIACVKHYVGNEQETNRNPTADDVPSTSANIDDQTMHELYLAPFVDAVHAGVGSVMCSYNRLNGTYGCENSKVLNSALKGEMNFQGFVVSDWVAQHSGVESANAGLDMAMPNSPYWDQGQLADFVDDGSVNRTRLEDMATRVITTWYQFGQNDSSQPSLGYGLAPDLLKPHAYVDAKDRASKPLLLQQAIESHVLVKNTNNSLPLRAPRVLSIYGYGAITPQDSDPGAGSIQGQTYDPWPQNWQAINLTVPNLMDIQRNEPMENPPSTYAGILTVGGGSGSNVPSYISSPYDADAARAYEDSTELFSDFSSLDPQVVGTSDACLVFINAFASEIWDRSQLADEDSDMLVSNVASQCNNTIVVIHNAGIRLVDEWVENPNVTAVIFAHLPGQDAGRALAAILYGDVSPSGRLPYTVGKRESDYGSLLHPCTADSSPDDPQCDFTEGVNIDYRSFLARKVTPRFAFGFGLTFSTFDYADLRIDVDVQATDEAVSTAPVYANGTTDQNSGNDDVIIGGLASLFEVVGEVSATVTNTGSVEAAEVAQLYLELPFGLVPRSNPKVANTRVLRGFDKVMVEPGRTVNVNFELRRKDVSRWDTVKQAWVVPAGTFVVRVGKSVLDTPLVGSFDVE